MMANNGEDTLVVSHDITNLAISDFIGTSQYHELEGGHDAELLRQLRRPMSKLNGSRGHNNTVIVVINNAEGLFEEGSALSKRQDVALMPKFYMENSPDSGFFEGYLHDLFNEMSTIKSLRSKLNFQDLNIATPNLMRWDNDFKTDLETVKDSVDKDLKYIQALVGTLSQDEHAVVHLKSLTNKQGQDYIEGKSKVVEGVMALLDEAISHNVVIITLPKETCKVAGDRILSKQLDKNCANHNKEREKLVKHSSSSPSSKSASVPSFSSQFSTQTQCEQATRNCSGHGSCAELNNGQFHCVCKPTFDKSTQRTTQWGGNACQKIDVSAPFHLLFWSTLGIIVMTVYGVRMLMTVGNEPLPGILGIAKKVDFK